MSITPYCKIGSTVLTSYLKYDRGRKQSGGQVKTKKTLAPDQDRSWLSHQGRSPKVWEFNLIFPPGDEAHYDTVLAAFDNAGLGDALYPYSADRFLRVGISSATSADPVHSGGYLMQCIKARVECELPWLFANTPTSWAPGWEGLDVTDSTGMVNAGKIDAPLYGLAVQAVPAGAGQVVATSADPNLNSAAISVAGDPNRYVIIRYRWVSGATAVYEIFYTTGAHGCNASYTKSGALDDDGAWHTIAIDMWALDAGGTDWKDNTITLLRVDYATIDAAVVDIEYVLMAEDAAAATIGAYFWADEWSLVNTTREEGEPDDLTYTLMDGATADGVITLATSMMSSELLSVNVLGQISRTYTFDPALVRSQEQFDTDFFWHAALVTALAGANNDLSIIAVALNSELPSLKLTDPAGNDQVLSVSVAGNDIDVSLATGPAGAITSTSTLVVAAINAKAEAAALVTAAVDGSDGSGVVTAMAKTNVVGPDVSSSKIAVAECESVVLKLTGPHPLSQNAKLTMIPTVGAGVGLYRISISTDSGSSYTELYDNTDLDDDETNAVWLSGTKGYVTVWVKIECDQDISVNLDDIETYVERYVPDADLPVIDVGATRKIKIDDSNDTIADITATWRNRWLG